MNTISVLIQHHAGPTGDVLVCQRPDGTWELPCGVAHTNEPDAEAAERIARERLSMQIRVGKLQMTGRKAPKDGYVEHIYEGNITHDTHTKCNFHNYYDAVNTWQTEPKAGDYTAFRWIHPSELGGVAFEGDDKRFIMKYDPWINGRSIPDVRMP